MKTVYTAYKQPQPNGAYFYSAPYADDFPTIYPQTEVAIPETLYNGMPKFDWSKNEWYDASQEAAEKLMSDLQKANTQLKTDLATAQADATAAKTQVGGLQMQVLNLTKQVLDLKAASAPAPEDDKEEK